MSMNMPHPTISKPNNKPVGTIPTYGVPSASFLMTGGIPRGGGQFTTPFAVPLYNSVMLPIPFPTLMQIKRAGLQPVVRVSRYLTATRTNRL